MLRTHSLIKAARVVLRTVLKSCQKLFIVAGSDHFFRNTVQYKVHGQHLLQPKYDVLDYFKFFKAAIILPKELDANGVGVGLDYAKKY
jgi:hypothetical protein